MRHVLFPLLACLMLLLMPAAVAQDATPQTPADEAHPLLDMLALVPDVPLVTETLVSYVDYAAMMTALGDVRPQSYADWAAFPSFQEGLWLMAMGRLMSPPNIFQALPQLDDSVSFNGFDVFAIDRAAAFGAPPFDGFIYGLDYSREALVAALAKRGYAEVAFGGLPALCTTPACDQGNAFDADDDIEPRNLFDTAIFRRRPPVLLLDSFLSSAYLPVMLEPLAAAIGGEGPSLAQNASYRALADAAIAEAGAGSVIQVQFWSALQVDADYVLVTPEQRAAAAAYLGEDDLPAYHAAAFIDLQLDGGTQAAAVALALDDAAGVDAEAAAALLAERLAGYAPIFFEDTTPFLDALEGYEITTAVYPAGDVPAGDAPASAVTVVVVTVRYPSPQINDGTGEVFRWWITGLNQAAFYPIWTDLSE